MGERQKEPTQTLRKHAKYRQRRRALAIWLRGDSRAQSPTSFPTFQKCLLSPVRANTVRMRRRRGEDAFESLLTLISAARSCYGMILVSAQIPDRIF